MPKSKKNHPIVKLSNESASLIIQKKARSSQDSRIKLI